MAVLIRPLRWGKTPPNNARVEAGHQLAQGLVAAYVPMPGARWVPNLAAGPQLTLVQSGTVTFATSQAGYGVASAAGAANLLTQSTNITLNAKDQVTIAWYGVPTAFSSGSPFISMLWGEEIASGFALRLGDSGNAQKVQLYQDSKKILGATNQTAGVPLLAVGVSSPSAFQVYTQGRLDGTTTANAAASALFRPSFNGQANSRYLTGVHVAGYAWNRPLTAAEIAWLWAEPFAFFTPAAPRISYFSVDAAIALSFTGAAALPALTAAATLAPSDPLTAAATLPALTASATLAPSDPLTAAATLPSLTGAATLAPSNASAADATLPALTAAATLEPAVAMTATALLPALTAAAVLGRIPAPRGRVTLTATTARGGATLSDTTSRGRITITGTTSRGPITATTE